MTDHLTLALKPNPADLILSARDAHIGALYLGSVSALTPEFLAKHKISMVVSMTKVKPVPSVLHFQYPIPDHRSANIAMQHIIPRIISKIHAHRVAGHNVLVHCYAGMHRAPTVVAQYLQRYEGHSVDSAVKLIRSARPLAFIDGNTFDLKYYF